MPLQTHQFLTLTVLFFLGKTGANIAVPWSVFFGVVFWAAALESVWAYRHYGPNMRGPWSAMSTAIGLMLMVSSSTVVAYLVGVWGALVQKHLLRCCGRHFFNPSNLGLVMILLLFYDQAHIIAGQLGESVTLAVLVGGLAATVLIRADRWRIPLVFTAAYLGAEYLWVVGYDPMVHFESVWYRFYSVSFIVFVVFMLTDPRTTPSRGLCQILFAAAIAIGAAGMDRWYGLRLQHLFVVLMLASVWVPACELSGEERKRALRYGGVLFLLGVGAIIYLQSQPPYYFEMEG